MGVAPNARPAAVADGTISASASASRSTATATSASVSAACGAGDLSLRVFESSLGRPASHGGSAADVPIGSGLLALHSTRVQQLTLVFTNVSHAACTMHGYPSVDFLWAGARGPLSAPDSFSRGAEVTDVRLSPGGAATSLIAFTTNGNANSRGSRCDAVVAVRVYPPGSTQALISGARDAGTGLVVPHFYVCGHKVVVQAVRAVQAR